MKFRSFLGTMIITLIGALATWYFTKTDNSLQYLEYYAIQSNNILDDSNFDIKVNSIEASEISKLVVRVFNDTNQDYDDLTLDILVKIDSPRVLGVHVKDSHGIKLHNLSSGELNKYSFTVRTANRSDQIPILEGIFLIKGSSSADCIVDIQKRGLSIKRIMSPEEKKERKARLLYGVLGGVILAVLVQVFILSWRKSSLLKGIEDVKQNQVLSEIIAFDEKNYWVDKYGVRHELPDVETQKFLSAGGPIPIDKDLFHNLKPGNKMESAKTAKKMKVNDGKADHMFVLLNDQLYYINNWGIILQQGWKDTDFVSITSEEFNKYQIYR